MTEQNLQLISSGITVGSIYALVGLGFTIIYNASDVVNFAQGEFVMIGGISSAFFVATGVPIILAILLSLLLTILVGLALNQFAIKPAKGASVVTTIIITIGASIFLRGVALLIWGKDFYSLPAFSGENPIHIGSATILPQNLWVIGVAAILVVAVLWFFNHTLLGKAVLACSCNRTAAQLVGINIGVMLLLSYGLSAMLGALAGVLIVPVTFTSYDAGVMLGLKGFSAAILGGIGNPLGAVIGGILLGLLESFGAGFISSGYKDALAFAIILLVLFIRPSGLMGKTTQERV